MTPLFLYGLIVCSIALLLFLLALREVFLLHRIPAGHHERGQVWFNMLFLIFSSGAVLWGGYYLDGGRREFDSMFISYPSARYAVEQNSIVRNQVWVYTTNKSVGDVMLFYREYARANRIEFFEQEGLRMVFSLPSGNLFLTIKKDGGKSLLYFSRDGRMYTTTQ